MLDALRTQHPDFGFAVYAYEPRGGVTLEVHAPDGERFIFAGQTLEACILAAFPPEPETPPKPRVNIFE